MTQTVWGPCAKRSPDGDRSAGIPWRSVARRFQSRGCVTHCDADASRPDAIDSTPPEPVSVSQAVPVRCDDPERFRAEKHGTTTAADLLGVVPNSYSSHSRVAQASRGALVHHTRARARTPHSHDVARRQERRREGPDQPQGQGSGAFCAPPTPRRSHHRVSVFLNRSDQTHARLPYDRRTTPRSTSR